MLYQRFCKQITSPKQHINTYNFYFKHEIGAFSRAKVHLLLHTTHGKLHSNQQSEATFRASKYIAPLRVSLPLCPPCFAEGHSDSDKSVCVLTSHFIRPISPISLMKILRSNASYCVANLRVSEPLENHTTCAPRFAEGHSGSF